MKNTKADGPLHRGKDQKYFPNKMRKRREWRRRERKERGRMSGCVDAWCFNRF
jgi:hypothetical protein